jgi:dihydrofolate synthase / folylpolyglutamate synthase
VSVVTITNIHQAEAALLPYVPLVKQLTGKDTTLDRIWPLMELLGNPQDKLKIIHIAGTSGKTSTAYYMAALLKAGGQKVGLTVSPHIDSVTERVQIDGVPLGEKEFCTLLGEFLDIVETAGQQPSYFELLYAFALWVFQKLNVDYGVVETGMGGLHDATNVARRPDKICVITDIGFDHTQVLGRTLEAITAQKIGIVHQQNHVFMCQQSDEIMMVVDSWIRQQSGMLHIVDGDVGQMLNPDMANYQRRNWRLANQVYEYLEKRDDLPHLTSQALQESQAVQVPGRMEIVTLHDKTIVMDGAHNEQKMTAFLQSFSRQFPDSKPTILIALKDEKSYQAVVALMKPLDAQVITTTFNTTQDLPVRSMDPELLAQAFKDQGISSEAVVDQAEAVKALLATPTKVGIITGSFYLLSQIRNNGYLL